MGNSCMWNSKDFAVLNAILSENISSILSHIFVDCKDSMVWLIQQGFKLLCSLVIATITDTPDNRVIRFLTASTVTWKTNYVSSMCGRLEGSLTFHTHSGRVLTLQWHLNKYVWVTAALMIWHVMVAPSAGRTTSLVKVRIKMNVNSVWQGVFVTW